MYLRPAHIAIDADGHSGPAGREGRDEKSTACGALAAFQKEMAGGRLNISMDNEDVQQSLLKMRSDQGKSLTAKCPTF